MAALGPLLAALGPLLGALGPLLGALGPLLGRSWAALGRSWAALGTTCKNHQKIDAKNDGFGPPKASQKPPQMTPKSNQKTIKYRCKKRSESTPPKSTKTHAHAHTRCSNISRILTRFGLQNASQMPPQNDPKTIKKTRRKKNQKND